LSLKKKKKKRKRKKAQANSAKGKKEGNSSLLFPRQAHEAESSTKFRQKNRDEVGQPEKKKSGEKQKSSDARNPDKPR
jgi:hypothetical protein